MAYCPKCRNTIDKYANHCPYCGHDFPLSSQGWLIFCSRRHGWKFLTALALFAGLFVFMHTEARSSAPVTLIKKISKNTQRLSIYAETAQAIESHLRTEGFRMTGNATAVHQTGTTGAVEWLGHAFVRLRGAYELHIHVLTPRSTTVAGICVDCEWVFRGYRWEKQQEPAQINSLAIHLHELLEAHKTKEESNTVPQ